MSIDIDPSFTFDAGGYLLEALGEDTGEVVTRVSDDFTETRCGEVLSGAAGLLVPNDTDELNLLRSRAFFGAGAVVAAAFMEADVPEDFFEKVMNRFALANLPCGVLSDQPDATFIAFQALAANGHRLHQELGEHVSLVAEYFIGLTDNIDMGTYTYTGSGFAIYQLAHAWEEARNHELDQRWAAAIQDFDINTLLS